MNEGRHPGRPQGVPEDVANNPCMFAREMGKSEALLLASEVGEIARRNGQGVEHFVGPRGRIVRRRHGRFEAAIIDRDGSDIGSRTDTEKLSGREKGEAI